MSSTRTAAMWMLVVAVASALQGTCIHALHGICDWRMVVLVRTCLGLLFALALVRAAGARIPIPGPRELWLRSAAGSVAFLCTFYAAAHIPIANVTVLLNTSPLWILLSSWLLLRHRLRASSWVAIVSGTVGIVCVVRPDFAHQNLGALAAAGAGILSAVSLMAINRMRHVHAAAIVAHASAAAMITSAIAVGTSAREIDAGFVHSPRALALLVSVALLGTTAQLAMTRAYASGNAARLAPLQYLAVAFGAFADYAFFGYVPDLLTSLGIALIAGPMLWIMTRRPEAAAVRHGDLGGVADTAAFAGPETLARLEAAVSRAERLTSCEVRIHLEQLCADRVLRPREVFGTLGIAKTKLRNGVLVYLALESRVFAIVIDEGLSDVVPHAVLDAACARLTAAMQGGDVVRVVEDGVVEVFGLLGRYFPYQRDDVNELDDAVSVGW